jgi:2-dehydropantoate 2-reductase
MDILIVGAGSIGVYLGTLLSSNDHNVFLLGRKKLKKLHETILIGEQVYELPKRIYSFPKSKGYDFVFITSKLYDLECNLRKVVENQLKTKFLLSIQNGIVQDELYEKYTNKFNFSSISVFEGFRIVENQLIVNKSKTGWKTDESKTGIETSKLLQSAGINCSTEKNLDSIKAEKTIMNCCVNVLSAIKKKTFFELYKNSTTKNLMDELFDESYSVLNQEYKLKSKEELRKLFYQIIEPMKHYSSTYQDAISGRKTEVQFLNGLILKLAKKHKLQAPTNQKVLDEFFEKYPKSK